MATPIPPEKVAQMLKLADEGVTVRLIAQRLEVSLSAAYRRIQEEERKRGKRAARPVQGKTPTKGWTAGRVKTPTTVCLCASCVAAMPWRAKLRRSA